VHDCHLILSIRSLLVFVIDPQFRLLSYLFYNTIYHPIPTRIAEEECILKKLRTDRQNDRQNHITTRRLTTMVAKAERQRTSSASDRNQSCVLYRRPGPMYCRAMTACKVRWRHIEQVPGINDVIDTWSRGEMTAWSAKKPQRRRRLL